MADIDATFDKMSILSTTHSGTSAMWVDITSNGPDTNSPIPSGKQLYIGYISIVSWDKAVTVQLRPNLATKSAGDDANTQLRGFSMVPGEDSKEIDLNYYGQILTLAPVTAQSTGVEKLWLKIDSPTAAAGDIDIILYYAIY